MATIDWAQAASGTWSTASDWTGGVVPGRHDTAVIQAANGRAKYAVTVASPVSVGALVLDSAYATLYVDSILTTPDLSLEAGKLVLDDGTLAGTVTSSSSMLDLAAGTDDTLKNVTWEGGFRDAGGKSTLTISGGLTLTGAGGTGPGTATFDGDVVFDGVKTLDNAVISSSSGTIEIIETKTLTLGSQLSVDYAILKVGSGVTLVNDGLLTNVTVRGGTLTNAGTIAGTSDIAAKSFTNDGLINVAGNELTLSVQGLQQAGPTGAIDVGSQGVLDIAGTLTTAQLNTLFTQQNVSGSGNFGTGITGTLNNAGAQLDIGTGSRFGAFDAAAGVITGGTVVDEGGNSFDGTLSTLTLQSQSGTLGWGYEMTLTDVTVTGATVLSGDGLICNGGTLSDVGTISVADIYGVDPDLILNGVDITGVDNSGAVTILASDMIQGLTITAAQSIAGYTIQLGDYTGLVAQGGAVLNDANVTFDSRYNSGSFIYGDYGDTTGATLGAGLMATITSGTDVVLIGRDEYSGSLLTSMGTFAVAGTLQIGYAQEYTDLDTTGAIDISATGTLLVQANADTILTNGGTIAAASGLIDIAASITNTGLISDAFGGSATMATIGGAITGAGTIAITGAGTLALGGSVAFGQIIQFGSGVETLTLGKPPGFLGTLDGFAKGYSVVLSGETVSSAKFSGASIVATLSAGGTIVLATGSHLSGALTVDDVSGNATLTYASGAPSLQDWSGFGVSPSENHAAPILPEVAGALPRWDAQALGMILSHRPWH